MKKILSTALILISLCIIFSIASSATEYVFDKNGYLHEEDIENLNKLGAELYTSYGAYVGILFAGDHGGSDLVDYTEEFYKSAAPTDNGILFSMDSDNYYFFISGSLEDCITDSDCETMWNAYYETDTYYLGANSFFRAAEQLLIKYGYPKYDPIGSEIPNERQLPRLNDNADILTDSEEKELLALLDEISERQQFDVVVLTVSDLPDGYTPMTYADDFYDYNGYGMGVNHDGAILLLSMAERDWYISTCGYGITAITDAGREYMADQFIPYLSDGDYSKGFTEFARQCDAFVTQANTGEPYDVGNLPHKTEWLMWIVFSLVIGLLIAAIIVNKMKKKLVSVTAKTEASYYFRPGSMILNNQRDTFLYAQTTRTKIERSSSSDGGSSTHTSSSGTSHGGGGGKF